MSNEKAKGTEYEYEVSVLILTYHPEWEKLKKTIKSIVFQKGIRQEIIVADDGSEKNYREELEALFASLDFADYQLVMNPVNHGTIANFFSGLEKARGEYVKSISPGDYLTGDGILREWLDFTKRSGNDWSFSEAVPYTIQNGDEIPAKVASLPVNLNPYRKGKIHQARWNYVVYDDAPYGAAILCKKAVILPYLHELMGVGNKYVEDSIYRLMMFDGICGCYYPKGTVFYEFGTGISTAKEDKWTKILLDEFKNVYQIIDKRKNTDAVQKKIQNNIHKSTVLLPGKAWRIIRQLYFPRRFTFQFSDTEAWRKLCR